MANSVDKVQAAVPLCVQACESAARPLRYLRIWIERLRQHAGWSADEAGAVESEARRIIESRCG